MSDDDAIAETAVAQTAAAGNGETLVSAPSPVRAGRALQLLPEGTQVGRYQLTGKLGAGGMGVVYRARDPRLDREVAVKLVARAGDVAAAQERLEREAQAMAKLSHPNVATVYDIGTYEDQLFVAMELCAKGSLAKWLREQRPWREVVRRFVAAGRGLAAAHQLGLVHRDFKPDNVLVGHDDASKVSDFGLVTSSAQHGTGTGSVEGTPAYMAPEQLEGRDVDARADQFAFAVSLWEGVCGGRPYQPEAGAEDPLDGMLRAIRARRRMRAHDTDVPARLLHVLERALEPDPADRWPSLEAMLVALEGAARPRWPRWVAAAGVLALVSGAVALYEVRPPEVDGEAAIRVQRASATILKVAGDVAFRRGHPFDADYYWELAFRATRDPVFKVMAAVGFIAADQCRLAVLRFSEIYEVSRDKTLYEAVERYHTLCDPPPDTVGSLDDPGKLLDFAAERRREGNLDVAYKALQKALQITNDPNVLRLLSDIDIDRGDCEAARDGYETYLRDAQPPVPKNVRDELRKAERSCQRR